MSLTSLVLLEYYIPVYYHTVVLNRPGIFTCIIFIPSIIFTSLKQYNSMGEQSIMGVKTILFEHII